MSRPQRGVLVSQVKNCNLSLILRLMPERGVNLRKGFLAIVLSLFIPLWPVSSFAELSKSPPIKLPFAVHKAGETISTKVILLEDRVYPFSMRFRFKEGDAIDRARVRNLVGEYQKDKNGKLLKPGIEIPLRFEIRSIDSEGKDVLLNQTVMVGRQYGYGADSFIREVGVIRLIPGRYQLTVQNLTNHPELEQTTVTFEMYAKTRGNVFNLVEQNPSTQMTRLLDRIYKLDLINHLSDMERLPDNTSFARNIHPHLEYFSIPMPVAIWQGCSYGIFIDADAADSFWISKNCGGDDRKVYKGKAAELFRE